MNAFLNIITNPVKTFNQLKEQEKFPVAPFIVLLTIVLINIILNAPITAKVSELLMSGMSISEQQLDAAIQMTHKLRYLSMIAGLITYIIMLFIYVLIFFVIAWIFRTNLNYSRALRLMIYCFIATAIGDLVNTALVYFYGIDSINSMYDAMMTGANRFTSVENVGIYVYPFLASINPFQIWFIVLLAAGFKIFTDSGWTKSLTVCIIYWLLVTIFPILVSYWSQALMESKGLM